MDETLEVEIINVVTGGSPDEDAAVDADPAEPEETLNPVSSKAAISTLHTINQWHSESGFLKLKLQP